MNKGNSNSNIRRVIALISSTIYEYEVSLSIQNASTADPFGMIPIIYLFHEQNPVTTNNDTSFVVKVTDKTMNQYFREVNSETDLWVIRYGLMKIAEAPTTKEFLLTTEEYDKIKQLKRNGGRVLRNKALEIFYNLYLSNPTKSITEYDLYVNLLYDTAEVQGWIQSLYDQDYLILEENVTSHAQRDVKAKSYRLNPKYQTTIESELAISQSNRRGLILDIGANRYFHLIETQSQNLGDFAFVLMPFKEEEFPQAVFDTFESVVKDSLSINCIKVSDDMFKNYIENKIWSHIVMSRFIIAELSTENPNVIFEFGQALALNKIVIPAYYNKYGRRDRKLAFDLEHFDTIFYNDLMELETKLSNSVRSLKSRK